MLNRCLYLIAVAVALAATPAFADLKAIHKDKLPQEAKVLNALAEVSAVEAMVDHWSDKWRYQMPKEQVAATLNRSLADLKETAEASPENEELLLLLGLVAHYSYNLDAEGTYEIAVDSFHKAQKLAPEDFRPAWFLGLHQCQSSSEFVEGMKKLLALENSKESQQLPAAFWDDYLQCAVVTNMPAHALRAGSRASKLDPQPSRMRTALVEGMQKRLLQPDPDGAYPAKQVWFAETTGASTVFTSFLFGLRFTFPGEWRLNLPEVQKAFGMAQFEVGPYAGKSGQVTPNIVVIARPPKRGETLQDLLLAVTKNHGGAAIPASVCPSQQCLAWEAVKPGMYKEEGDGHMIVTAFERDTPDFPGLSFENPAPLPNTPKDSQVHAFHPEDRLQRFPGKLYYLVMLDTASSVLEKAKQDYESFLKNLQVE